VTNREDTMDAYMTNGIHKEKKVISKSTYVAAVNVNTNKEILAL